MKFWKSEEEKLVDYITDETNESNRFAVKCLDDLEKQGNTLLSVLLTGGGGALALAVTLAHKNADMWLLFGTAVVSAYLFIIAGILLWKCLWSEDVYSGFGTPNSLYIEGCSVSYIKKHDLDNKQLYIERNRERTYQMAKWLNIARLLSIATPLIFAIFSTLFFYGFF